MSKHKLDIDDICDLIIEGENLRNIASSLQVPLSSLHAFLSKRPEHYEKLKTAQILSAEAFAAKAEEALLSLSSSSTTSEIAQAKELASHYRWLSAKRNPLIYSDKLAGQIDLNVTKKREFKVKIAKREDGTNESYVEGGANE